MIRIGKWLLLYIWLLLLGVVQAPCAVLDASQNRVREIFTADYDAIGRANIDYDGASKSFSDYDAAPPRAQTESERRTEAQRTSFALSGRLPAAKGIPNITEKGLLRVESHLDDVLKNQFSDLPRSTGLKFQAGERSMLERLRSGATSSQDIEFYMHELKESARFRATGNLMDAHNSAIQWRGVTSKDLFHPDVISAHPEIFGSGW